MYQLPLSPGAQGNTPADVRDVYEAVGDAVFRALVEAFYRRVEADPLLAPMLAANREESRDKQYRFLVQYFGGPALYAERYGHPRLRMRHFPFAIGREARDAWLGHMLAAMAEVAIPEPWAGVMRSYFESTSLAMMNQPS